MNFDISSTWVYINISDKIDGPLSTNIIIVLIAYEIIKADQTAWRKQHGCLTAQRISLKIFLDKERWDWIYAKYITLIYQDFSKKDTSTNKYTIHIA